MKREVWVLRDLENVSRAVFRLGVSVLESDAGLGMRLGGGAGSGGGGAGAGRGEAAGLCGSGKT